MHGRGDDVRLVMDFTNASAADGVFEYLTAADLGTQPTTTLFSTGRVPCGAQVCVCVCPCMCVISAVVHTCATWHIMMPNGSY